MKAAAFSGDYCDLKFVKTRKVAQITIEIPIEQAAAFVASFGAPDPAQGVPVALARLNAPASQEQTEPPVKDRKAWADLPCSQQAAIRCGEQAFWRFLEDTEQKLNLNVVIDSAEKAADCVRLQCHAKSRSEFDVEGKPRRFWKLLEDEYQFWLRVPV